VKWEEFKSLPEGVDKATALVLALYGAEGVVSGNELMCTQTEAMRLVFGKAFSADAASKVLKALRELGWLDKVGAKFVFTLPPHLRKRVAQQLQSGGDAPDTDSTADTDTKVNQPETTSTDVVVRHAPTALVTRMVDPEPADRMVDTMRRQAALHQRALELLTEDTEFALDLARLILKAEEEAFGE
jgi:hypothetical protein